MERASKPRPLSGSKPKLYFVFFYETAGFDLSVCLQMIFYRYRIWRTKYDFVSVCKHKKFEFRSLWNNERSETQDSQRAPLDLVESEFRSSSGSIYDFMVSRAEHDACHLMYVRHPSLCIIFL